MTLTYMAITIVGGRAPFNIIKIDRESKSSLVHVPEISFHTTGTWRSSSAPVEAIHRALWHAVTETLRSAEIDSEGL